MTTRFKVTVRKTATDSPVFSTFIFTETSDLAHRAVENLLKRRWGSPVAGWLYTVETLSKVEL